MFSCSSNCFILKFQEEQVMFTKSVRTLDFFCSVWFKMSMWSKSLQWGSTRFSLPTFVFTSKEVNYFFLWTRFCELNLSEISEFRLKKMEPRLKKQIYEMHPGNSGWLFELCIKFGARTTAALDFSSLHELCYIFC